MSDTHVWLREARGGYGYIDRVPCRLLGSSPSGKRMKIAAHRRDGTEVIRFVALEKLRPLAASPLKEGE